MQKSGSQSELVKGTEHEVTKVAKFRKTEYKQDLIVVPAKNVLGNKVLQLKREI